MRVRDASAVRVELQPVIAASDAIAGQERSEVKRDETVRTDVRERDDGPALGAEEQQRLA
jgi:hypothetical protein